MSFCFCAYFYASDDFDVSKVHDIYDCAKYDFIHNRHLGPLGVRELSFLPT